MVMVFAKEQKVGHMYTYAKQMGLKTSITGPEMYWVDHSLLKSLSHFKKFSLATF